MNLYATLEELYMQRNLVERSAARDALLLRLAEAASREIDALTRRHYYTELREITVDTTAASLVLELPDDALAIDQVWTDDDGDGVAEAAWDAGEWLALPLHAAVKAKLAVAYNARRTFPRGTGAVRLRGTWGYGDGMSASPWRALGISVSFVDDQTPVGTASGAGIEAGMTLLIESEQLYVQDVEGSTLRVLRAVNGTTAAAHADAPAARALYPPRIREAAAWLAGVMHARCGFEGLDAETIEGTVRRWASEEEIRATLDRALGPFRRVLL